MARTQKRVTVSGVPRYVAKWRDPDGTDHSKGGFANKKAAADYARNAESAAAQGIVFDPAKGKMNRPGSAGDSHHPVRMRAWQRSGSTRRS
jgi:hypothetical protein